MDVLGQALKDYHEGHYPQDIITRSSLGDEDIIPLPYLFRTYEDMPSLEQKALTLCKGHVLDIGCGAGCHSLYLQQKGYKVTALDHSVGAIEVSKARGVKNTICTNILDHGGHTYDTLLLLMNGIGLASQLDLLGPFLEHLKKFLNPGGQILLDSSDIIYTFEKEEATPDDRQDMELPSDHYYGEVVFTMQYRDKISSPFFLAICRF